MSEDQIAEDIAASYERVAPVLERYASEAERDLAAVSRRLDMVELLGEEA
jgi:hypothetical protein